MTMFLAPYTAIADIDGSPLDAGFLFFGESGKNPELYPIPVYWDADFTVPAAQPIRTRNGYPIRNGSPCKIYLKQAEHSLVIKNKNLSAILIEMNNKGISSSLLVRPNGDTVETSLTNIDAELNNKQQQIDEKPSQQYVDEELDLKAPKETTYTKTEVDSALSLKAPQSNTYTKAEVDNTFAAYIGGRKAFTTLALAQAARSSLPANTAIEVTNDGANNGTYQWNGTTLTKSAYDPLTQAKLYTDSITTNILSAAFTESGYISATGALLASSGYKSTGFIKVVPDQSYRVYSQIAGAARHAWYDKNQVFISAFGEDQTTLTEKTYVAPANAAYIRVSAYQAAAWDVAYIKSKTYVIEIIEKIIQQHMPNVDASKIDYSSSNVKATLDTVISKQNSIITNQNNIVGQLDLMTDKESPYFVNTAKFVKAVLTPTNFGVVNVTARVSDTQMTVSDPAAFIYSGSCVVYDQTANSYTSHNVIGITCETATPTWAALSGIFAYKKSAKTSKASLFKDGDVIAFLGDSWTQYPIASTIGETGQTRPDGSISTGSQWLSRRMKEKLQSQGKNVTMLNMGFGGQTSRWGKYWVNTILSLEQKPTHCVLCFYINDNNGITNPSATAYDFDPVSMFVNKTVANGGISGRVQSYDEWEANIKWLCDKLIENGIKPIVIMPSQTASATQAQNIRSGQLDRITDGF